MIPAMNVTPSTTLIELERLLASLGASLSVSPVGRRSVPTFIAVVDGLDPAGNVVRAVETRSSMTEAIAAAVSDYGVRLGRAMSSGMLAASDNARAEVVA